MPAWPLALQEGTLHILVFKLSKDLKTTSVAESAECLLVPEAVPVGD